MEQQLHREIERALQTLFEADGERDVPVVQSHSLFFWSNLADWVKQIATLKEPFTIALTGASGSGKSFIREVLVSELSKVSEVASFTQDNYYRDFEADFPHLPLSSFYDEINLDDPAHIRFTKLADDLRKLKRMPYGSHFSIPKLIYGTPTSKPTIVEGGTEMEVTPFIVTEGIHSFCDSGIIPHYNLKIFVDIDEAERRRRWLERNQRENRGTTDNMWNTTVECMNQYILPTRPVADLIVNNNAPQEDVTAFLEDIVDILTTATARVWMAHKIA